MVIVPSIDLRDGKVVRLLKGDYAQQTTYDVDPVEVARAYQNAGARWLHIVDLDGAKTGRPAQVQIVRRVIESVSMAVQVGGGVRNTGDIDALLSAGATRVVVGTAAIEQWSWFSELARDPKYAGKLVLALDAKDGVVATRGWTESSGRRATDLAADVRGWSLGAILYTDVAVDGTLAGPSIDRTRELVRATDVPVIASGGVGSIDHIRQLLPIDAWGVIVGRSLYEGKLDVAEAIRCAAREH